MSYSHKLHLDDTQIKKLLKGNPVQLKHNSLTEGNKSISVTKKTNTKIERAKRNGRGLRLRLEPSEIEANGGALNWKKIGRQVGNVTKMITHGAAKTGLLQTGLTAALTTLAGVPPPLALGLAGTAGHVVKTLTAHGLARKSIHPTGLIPLSSAKGLMMTSMSMRGQGIKETAVKVAKTVARHVIPAVGAAGTALALYQIAQKPEMVQDVIHRRMVNAGLDMMDKKLKKYYDESKDVPRTGRTSVPQKTIPAIIPRPHERALIRGMPAVQQPRREVSRVINVNGKAIKVLSPNWKR